MYLAGPCCALASDARACVDQLTSIISFSGLCLLTGGRETHASEQLKRGTLAGPREAVPGKRAAGMKRVPSSSAPRLRPCRCFCPCQGDILIKGEVCQGRESKVQLPSSPLKQFSQRKKREYTCVCVCVCPGQVTTQLSSLTDRGPAKEWPLIPLD